MKNFAKRMFPKIKQEDKKREYFVHQEAAAPVPATEQVVKGMKAEKSIFNLRLRHLPFRKYLASVVVAVSN